MKGYSKFRFSFNENDYSLEEIKNILCGMITDNLSFKNLTWQIQSYCSCDNQYGYDESYIIIQGYCLKEIKKNVSEFIRKYL